LHKEILFAHLANVFNINNLIKLAYIINFARFKGKDSIETGTNNMWKWEWDN